MNFDEVAEESAVFNLMTVIRGELLAPGLLFQRPHGSEIGVHGNLLVNDVSAERTYAAIVHFAA